MALVLSSVNEWLAQAQAAWQTFAEAFKNALDEGKVGTEAAARNKYLAVVCKKYNKQIRGPIPFMS